MPEAIYVGGIGSTNTELSKEILDSTTILEDTMLRLQGYVKLSRPDGSQEIIKVGDRKYDDKVIAWMRGKLLEVLNKNMYLSNLSTQDMYREARCMALGFWDELWISWGEFGLTPGQMVELLHLYSNFLSQAVRHPLQEGIRKMLKETTSEATSRMIQSVNETNDKPGGIFGIFGRR